MGTNFDFVPSKDNPLHEFGSIHLGKSSMGWRFGFHGYKVNGGTRRVAVDSGLTLAANVPSLHVVDFADVLRLINSGGYIEDEYRQEHSVADFIKMVEEKQHDKSHAKSFPDDRNWTDALGNSFSNYAFS